jgi:hypothetical protein
VYLFAPHTGGPDPRRVEAGQDIVFELGHDEVPAQPALARGRPRDWMMVRA